MDEPYPARQTFAAGGIDGAIDASLAEGLKELAAREGTTQFAVLLAAYAVVLTRLTGCDDLLVAVPMAARTRPETESVVGLVMNTVAIRIRVDAGGTLRDLVRAVHTATTRALAQQELPMARVVELVRPDRDPARTPLVQVLFAMEESWAVPDRGGLSWRPELIQNGTAKFEIELTVTGAPAGPQVRVNYNSDLFHAATGQRVADGFTAILHCLHDDPGLLVADAEIMSSEEFALVTRVWPDGGPVADPDATALAQLWAACASDAVVAIGPDGALTGTEVRELARRIAAAVRRTRRRRVRPGRDPAAARCPVPARDTRRLVGWRVLRAAGPDLPGQAARHDAQRLGRRRDRGRQQRRRRAGPPVRALPQPRYRSWTWQRCPPRAAQPGR